GRYRAWLPGESGCRPVPEGACRENAEVQPGAASREDATSGVRSVRDRQPERRETGNVQFPGLYAYLREEEEQWTIHGAAADDPQEVASEAERSESRASAAHAHPHPRTGQVVASGGAWAHPVLRGAHESTGAVALSVPGGAALASHAVA